MMKREMGLGRRSAAVTAMLGVQISVVTFDAERALTMPFPRILKQIASGYLR